MHTYIHTHRAVVSAASQRLLNVLPRVYGIHTYIYIHIHACIHTYIQGGSDCSVTEALDAMSRIFGIHAYIHTYIYIHTHRAVVTAASQRL